MVSRYLDDLGSVYRAVHRRKKKFWETVMETKAELPCDHPHLDGIDQATGPDKVWECQSCKGLFREVKDGIYTRWVATVRQSSSLSESGAESAHSGKQNT